MMKKLKHNTTIMKESMKRSKGPRFLDPEFETAVEHHKEVTARIKSSFDDAQNVIACIPRIFKNNADLARMTEQSYASFPETERTLSERLSALAAEIQTYLDEDMKQKCEDDVLKPFRDLLARMAALKGKKKAQRDNFLILESNKGKLEQYKKECEKKSSDKKAAKVAEYEEKVKSRTDSVVQIETEFISEMRDIWEHRFELVGKPLQMLLVTVCEVGKAVAQKAVPIMDYLGPDYMAREYKAEEPAEKKKKK